MLTGLNPADTDPWIPYHSLVQSVAIVCLLDDFCVRSNKFTLLEWPGRSVSALAKRSSALAASLTWPDNLAT